MALGIIGTYVVTRRISSIAGAISHSVLGGIGAALYLQAVARLAMVRPACSAPSLAALAAAVVIGLVSLYAKQREDTVIGALWAAGMAVGLLFFAKTPGYADPMSYLFGNILTITHADLRHVIAAGRAGGRPWAWSSTTSSSPSASTRSSPSCAACE